ncbi:hypothetical protein FRB99_006441 [Tulasnella sp. 403]|nr:hypothetical protein FRB99_006441 [Tulasnella sp. 403]
MPSSPNAKRRRANSVQQFITEIEPSDSDTPPSSVILQNGNHHVQNGKPRRSKRAFRAKPTAPNMSKGLWKDLTSMNWMRVPLSSFVLMCIPVILYINWQIISPGVPNPFRYLLAIQHRLEDSPDDAPLFQKGYGDLAFLAYYVIVFSFLRQTLTIHVFRPLAIFLGLRKEAKIDRFTEQCYAMTYWGTTGVLGLSAMRSMNTWYFEGRHFFQDYPYWRMSRFMKWYYLLQFSFWLQQSIILALRLEKPRKDFQELVGHHIVTLWLIGYASESVGTALYSWTFFPSVSWSYLVNLTPIGNAVFITMDSSDVFLAFSKSLNYLGLEKTSAASFAFFIGVWTYTRHYLNIYILYAVYKYFDLIPQAAQKWAPSEGVWMAPWMKWQIFFPLALLQGVNLFWYVFIWRIAYRAIFKSELADERSDDEDDGLPEEDDKDD